MAILKQLDSDSPECFDPILYHQIDLMIGTAFHSVLFAVQAGIPVIAIDYAPKVHHFMVDSGLTRYLLAPDEHKKLSKLVDEVLMKRSEIRADLLTIRMGLGREARQSLYKIREQIMISELCQPRSTPRTTIAVLGSGSVEADQRTLASCAAQTYTNVEVLFVSSGLHRCAGSWLQRVLKQSSGEYLTWIDGGDWFAEDSVACLVSCLEEKPDWDVVYADYYVMNDKNLPVGYQTVPGPEKLYRRDVVGPCFLMRQALLPMLDEVTAHTPLSAYSLWLQVKTSHKLVPFHAPLFYSLRCIRSRSFVAKERKVRRYWRRTSPLWKRVLWRLLDSDLGEWFFIRPVAYLLRLFQRRSNAERF
jgi:hypothetical protein